MPTLEEIKKKDHEPRMFELSLACQPLQLAEITRFPSTEMAFMISMELNKISAAPFAPIVRTRSKGPFFETEIKYEINRA